MTSHSPRVGCITAFSHYLVALWGCYRYVLSATFITRYNFPEITSTLVPRGPIDLILSLGPFLITFLSWSLLSHVTFRVTSDRYQVAKMAVKEQYPRANRVSM